MDKLQPNNGFGAELERYSWSQTLSDITILIPVAASTKGRNIKCNIEPNHLFVSLVGDSQPVIDGTLYERIKVDNSVWTLEGEGSTRLIRVELDKNEGDHWWPYVVVGEPEVDVSKIDPPPVNLDSLDGSLRSQYDQRQKENGLPTSDEEKKAEILKNFMKQHPEMDFSNAVVE